MNKLTKVQEKIIDMFLEQLRARIYPNTLYSEDDLESMIHQSMWYLKKENMEVKTSPCYVCGQGKGHNKALHDAYSKPELTKAQEKRLDEKLCKPFGVSSSATKTDERWKEIKEYGLKWKGDYRIKEVKQHLADELEREFARGMAFMEKKWREHHKKQLSRQKKEIIERLRVVRANIIRNKKKEIAKGTSVAWSWINAIDHEIDQAIKTIKKI